MIIAGGSGWRRVAAVVFILLLSLGLPPAVGRRLPPSSSSTPATRGHGEAEPLGSSPDSSGGRYVRRPDGYMKLRILLHSHHAPRRSPPPPTPVLFPTFPPPPPTPASLFPPSFPPPPHHHQSHWHVSNRTLLKVIAALLCILIVLVLGVTCWLCYSGRRRESAGDVERGDKERASSVSSRESAVGDNERASSRAAASSYIELVPSPWRRARSQEEMARPTRPAAQGVAAIEGCEIYSVSD